MPAISKSGRLRIEQVQQQMMIDDVDLLVVGPSEDFQYLIGYSPLTTERLTALLIPKHGTPTIITPGLESPNFRSMSDEIELIIWDETESPIDHIADRARKLGVQSIAVNDHLWSSFLIAIQRALPTLSYATTAPVIEPLRLIKDAREIESLREAARKIDTVWSEFCETTTLTGQTELDIAARIKVLMYAHGFSDVGWCDVGSGPNGASPLHHGSDRVIESGDPVVIDFAGIYRGYFADICRTPVAGDPDEQFREVYEIVREAQELAFRAVRPGVSCQDVDRAARAVIDDSGYGKYFIHRVGHGLGISAHEQPYIVEGNKTLLEVGMVFSNEPGVYIPERWGVRIEDILVVTTSGAERLNSVSRELTVLP